MQTLPASAPVNKFSVITPTNNPTYLETCFTSLQDQTFPDWEWVLLLNGSGEKLEQLRKAVEKITVDGRVKVFETLDTGNIGKLKKAACKLSKGEYLVELDHDDFLSPYALEELNKAIVESEYPPDFLYSDFAEFYEDPVKQNVKTPIINSLGEQFGNIAESYKHFRTYGHKYGWHSGISEEPWITQYGLPENILFMRSFPFNPNSLSAIHYAPNHVRVWRKEFYNTIGGHNENLIVCDDYELVLRTALNSQRIAQIKKPLYFYRLRSDSDNSYLIHNAKIQTDQAVLGEQYIEALALKWAEQHGYEKLDMGGAFNSPAGYSAVDIHKPEKDGTYWYAVDVTKQDLPFIDDSVGVIRASDFMEHIRGCESSSCTHNETYGKGRCVVGVMNEFWRVLRHGGVLILNTPSSSGWGADQDPTHISRWNPNSLWYYTDPFYSKFIRNLPEGFMGGTDKGCMFTVMRNYEYFPSDWHKENNIPYVKSILFAWKPDGDSEALAGHNNWL